MKRFAILAVAAVSVVAFAPASVIDASAQSVRVQIKEPVVRKKVVVRPAPRVVVRPSIVAPRVVIGGPRCDKTKFVTRNGKRVTIKDC